jgi:hypothetical protein
MFAFKIITRVLPRKVHYHKISLQKTVLNHPMLHTFEVISLNCRAKLVSLGPFMARTEVRIDVFVHIH